MKNKKECENKRSFKQYVKKHRALVTVVLIMASLVCVILPSIFLADNFFGKDTSRFEIMQGFSIIITNVFLLAGAIIAVWQYYISSTHTFHQIESDKVARGVELARYYKDDIIMKFGAARRVLKDIEIYDIILKHINSMENFDTVEKEKIFTKEEIEKIRQAKTFQKSFEAIYRVNKHYNLNLFNSENEIASFTDDDKEKICDRFWKGFVSEILNNAEYFAMHFSHGIADDSVIYQSIYPNYIEMCCAFYCEITSCRAPHKARLYINVVHLFNKWKKKSDKQMEEMIETIREASELGTVVKTEIC